MGDIVNFSDGVSPVEGLSMKEYRRLANVMLLQYDAPDFSVIKVIRASSIVKARVQLRNKDVKTVQL